jgi:predicted homoserine dehydrogenase-like protein
MGAGIAHQVRRTPGMELAAVVDISLEAARRAAHSPGIAVVEHAPGEKLRAGHGQAVVSADLFPLLEGNVLQINVLVEATNTVDFAARAVECALKNRIHVVLMNAEVDLLLGPWLHQIADAHGVGITSDAGDQHGVLMRMIDEIQLWGFDIAMAGNIKGFLDRYATASSIAEEARQRHLNPIQCVAYTDGTKLNIEMALVANATGLLPFCRGMEGPRAEHVSEVFERFDFSRYGDAGIVDYILGAAPHGGVFVVGRCDDAFQQRYLQYYKLGNGPYYLFYRPYHLCHVETPRAVARLCLFDRRVLEPVCGKLTEVVALAKRSLPPGTRITHGIGSDDLYGMIERAEVIEREAAVPVGLLDFSAEKPCVVTRQVGKDDLLTLHDLDMPGSALQDYYAQQRQMETERLRRGPHGGAA